MFDVKKKFTSSEIKSLEERYHKKGRTHKETGFRILLDP